jgi:hypothetical protein
MKKQNMKKLLLACLATASLLSFSSCDTVDERDDDDDDNHRHDRGVSTTTTTTEETTLSRHVPGAPVSSTVETQTIRSY